MKLRKAVLEDLPVLNRISVTAKKHWGYPNEWIERWLDDLTLTPTDLEEQSILVAENREGSLGFCAIKEEAEYVEINHLWILPEFIGKGFGKRLLEAALQKFSSSQKPIQVVADPNAALFYQKQGFVTFKQIESFPKGRFLPVMEKRKS
ncbi:GNAT family N-acetyltransferase [Flammeovirgaceae bacterium SG7u.111]|nr:GNAT family N-acetyltransferase [Flammeovirgaceae bacterium SG7u.132]WPO33222.1 GNAT family N-acetyltransferase [Flammeovirgaceae bacterium SG7u.111]